MAPSRLWMQDCIRQWQTCQLTSRCGNGSGGTVKNHRENWLPRQDSNLRHMD